MNAQMPPLLPAGGVPANDVTRVDVGGGKMRIYLLGNATRGFSVGAIQARVGGGSLLLPDGASFDLVNLKVLEKQTVVSAGKGGAKNLDDDHDNCGACGTSCAVLSAAPSRTSSAPVPYGTGCSPRIRR